MSLLNTMIRLEDDDELMSNKEVLEFFAELIKTKQKWALQGQYGKFANDLIEKNVISKEGLINWELSEEYVSGKKQWS